MSAENTTGIEPRKPVGFQKGQGGRPKGSKNRKTLEFEMRMDELREKGLDCDPIRVLMEIALGKEFDEDTKTLSPMAGVRPQDRAYAAAELCSYVYPKRKAIEVTGNEGQPIMFGVMQDTTPLPTMPGEDDEETPTLEGEATILGLPSGD